MKGRLVVFEYVDGGGTETQSKLLLDYLKNKGLPAERLSYPDYGQPLGRLIHEYLHRKFELSNETLVLLHLADRNKDRERVRRWLEEGRVVIADRYITSTMAYQGFAGFPVERIIRLAELFNLPKPDAIIYLRVSAETSMKRKLKEKNRLDRNESDSELMKDMNEFYLKLAGKNTFGRWVVIDGEQSKERVFGEVRKALGL